MKSVPYIFSSLNSTILSHLPFLNEAIVVILFREYFIKPWAVFICSMFVSKTLYVFMKFIPGVSLYWKLVVLHEFTGISSIIEPLHVSDVVVESFPSVKQHTFGFSSTSSVQTIPQATSLK